MIIFMDWPPTPAPVIRRGIFYIIRYNLVVIIRSGVMGGLSMGKIM
jgi:hypothetical protein